MSQLPFTGRRQMMRAIGASVIGTLCGPLTACLPLLRVLVATRSASVASALAGTRVSLLGAMRAGPVIGTGVEATIIRASMSARVSAVGLTAAYRPGALMAANARGRMVLQSERGRAFANFEVHEGRAVVTDIRTGGRISSSRMSNGRIQHFNNRGDSIGYSQYSRDGARLNHYNADGELIGYDVLAGGNQITSYMMLGGVATVIAQALLPAGSDPDDNSWTLPVVLLGVDAPPAENESIRVARDSYSSAVERCEQGDAAACTIARSRLSSLADLLARQ